MNASDSYHGRGNSKLKVFFLLIFFSGIPFFVKASTHNITVQNFSFTPNNVHALVGDTIIWNLRGEQSFKIKCNGIQSGTTLPVNAAPWDVMLDLNNTEFKYVITFEGIYKYVDPDYFGIGMRGEINAQITLPVELTDFVATTIKNEVILDWYTGGEINNDRFEIQRVDIKDLKDYDPDDLPFYTVGSLRGHGTSNIANHYKFKDRNLKSGKYLYRLKQVDYNSNFIFHLLTDEILIGIPDKLTLSQNYPNPFNPSTKINFQLPEDGFVNISVYDPSGKQIINLINESRVAGYQTFEIDGSLLSSGVYYYRLIFESSGNIRSYTRKMMLIK